MLNKLESCFSDSDSNDDCLVRKVFSGRVVSELRCFNCALISGSYENTNNLSLGIEDVDTLLSALSSYTKVEKLECQDKQFTCENCKQEGSLEKQLRLDHTPLVAIFHFNRFKIKGNSVEKIDEHVAFPLELDLLPYTSANQTTEEELKYQLYAVVKHTGKLTYGHYICYIRSSLHTWHEFDDGMVSRVTEENVLSQETYMLLYARQDIPWFSTAINITESLEEEEENEVIEPSATPGSTRSNCSDENNFSYRYSGCGPWSCTLLKDEKRGIHRRGLNAASMDRTRIQTMRYAQMMPIARGSKFRPRLAIQTGGKTKKRSIGSSSTCKKVGPRYRHDDTSMSLGYVITGA